MEASLVAQTVKCLSVVQETWVQSLGCEDPLEKEMIHRWGDAFPPPPPARLFVWIYCSFSFKWVQSRRPAKEEIPQAQAFESCVYSQSRPSLWGPMDCSRPGSSVHGVQARILECSAISYPRGSSQPKDWTWGLLCLLHWQVDSLPLATWEACLNHMDCQSVPGLSLCNL